MMDPKTDGQILDLFEQIRGVSLPFTPFADGKPGHKPRARRLGIGVAGRRRKEKTWLRRREPIPIGPIHPSPLNLDSIHIKCARKFRIELGWGGRGRRRGGRSIRRSFGGRSKYVDRHSTLGDGGAKEEQCCITGIVDAYWALQCRPGPLPRLRRCRHSSLDVSAVRCSHTCRLWTSSRDMTSNQTQSGPSPAPPTQLPGSLNLGGTRTNRSTQLLASHRSYTVLKDVRGADRLDVAGKLPKSTSSRGPWIWVM
mmetsp:Transcript_15992/g.45895  ORF Transcript_15992/g.45895 Transcript_15992/m.45895 type:complete len:254 (+) Transcript_15992:306-1067(+)